MSGPSSPPPGGGVRDPRLGTPPAGVGHAAAILPPPLPRRRRTWGPLWLTLVGLATAATLVLVAAYVGPRAAVVGGVLALVPLGLVLLALRWLDRWEPEPRAMLWFAALWGAGVSVLVAMLLNEIGAGYFYERTGDPQLALELTATSVAPLVEETAKGLGVLAILLARRRYFDGPVDGVVYAGTIAAGFAFSENVLYFGQAAGGLANVFVMRAVLAPFAHVLFTACIGLALGLASRRRNGAAVAVAFPLGLAAAVGLHALWNASTALGSGFLGLYVLVHLPLFVGAVALAAWLGRQEATVIRDRLDEYAAAGWFLPHEVTMLASQAERRRARAWAGRYGPPGATAMRSFQRHATDLAFYRQRALTGRADLRAPGDEAALLAAVGRDRAAFSAARGGRPVHPAAPPAGPLPGPQ